MKQFILAAGLLLAALPAQAAYTVYSGCAVPGTFTGHTWYFDPVNGKTQAAYTGLGIANDGSPTGQGSAAHPWNSLKAVAGTHISGNFGHDTGYSTYLLNSVDGTGPIHPGDKLLLMSGDYGNVSISDFNREITNSDWVIVQAAPGQTPVLETLGIARTNKWVFDGLKIQSIKGTNGNTDQLVTVGDQGVNFPTSDIILNNLNVSVAEHSDTLAWTQADWAAKARIGMWVVGTPGNGTNGVPYTHCVSVANTHVHDVYQGILVMANNMIATKNEIDHVVADMIDFAASNIAITQNYGHDNMTIDANHEDFAQGQNGPIASGVAYNQFSNVLIDSNVAIRQTDPNLKFTTYLQGISIFDEDWTNLTITNNIIVTSACWSIIAESVHNSLIANNTTVDDGVIALPGCTPEIALGARSHQGPDSTNSRLTNNTGPSLGVSNYLPGVTADHNLIQSVVRPGNGARYTTFINGVNQFYGLPGTYDNGNIIDAVGPAGEFVTYNPSTFTYDLTPKATGMLIGNGTQVGSLTTLLDIKGTLRTAPWTVGAITPGPTTPTPTACKPCMAQ